MNKVMDLLNKQIVTQKDTSASVLEPRIEGMLSIFVVLNFSCLIFKIKMLI